MATPAQSNFCSIAERHGGTKTQTPPNVSTRQNGALGFFASPQTSDIWGYTLSAQWTAGSTERPIPILPFETKQRKSAPSLYPMVVDPPISSVPQPLPNGTAKLMRPSRLFFVVRVVDFRKPFETARASEPNSTVSERKLVLRCDHRRLSTWTTNRLVGHCS